MPSPKYERSMNYGNLAGGLNIWELDYRLRANESPDMKNLVWKDGCLNSRNGQVWVDDTDKGVGYTAYETWFHGAIIFHAGVCLGYIRPEDEEPEPNVLYDGSPADPTDPTSPSLNQRGTFFLYDTKLYYKAPGYYICIEYDPATDTFTADDVVGYVPITYINCSPSNGAGDAYQPENFISPECTLEYNAESGVTSYHLPVVADSVTKVMVDGVEVTADSSSPPAAGKYYYDSTNGIVVFGTAPPVTNPPTNNTVVITYSLENETAMNNIMDCPYAAVYGGTGSLCIVMAGSKTQPNAYFWNGNNVAMDATYWPMTQYQLAGDSSDPITGFGRQQSYLVIFKKRTVGRTMISTQYVAAGDITFGVEDTSGRLTIDLPYIQINDKIGCDLPWSIQLIENNLVWCNTEQGVHYLKDSSSAYENNIVCLSKKVNGSQTRHGLLDAMRAANPDMVCSCDDTRKYWVVADGQVWSWDYSLSDYKDPSWFYFTNIRAMAFIVKEEDVWHVDTKGRITHFERTFADYNSLPIDKAYQFATQYFGTYDNLKNVNSIIITMRSDTNGTSTLQYITDYERRYDLTPLKVRHWLLSPRNLTYRSLAGRGFAEVFRRRPMCRRVRHYTMRLENNSIGEDLSIVSAEVFFNLQGKDRGRQIL